jgi:glycosyltransferase involved in cell wall biosynthesis
MKILIATDAWHPQINGVVRSLQQIAAQMALMNIDVSFITPQLFKTIPLPTYPEIRLSLASQKSISIHVEHIKPDHIHIATEGPIGFQMRRFCLQKKRIFTTSYHTRFPEYISARWPFPEHLSYAILRRFHNAGSGIMVATKTMRDELQARGFNNIMPWSRGVDSQLYYPRDRTQINIPELSNLPRPFFLYVGRVSVEKNLEAFLSLDLPGTKIIVGDGPNKTALENRYPRAKFLGTKQGEDLAQIYAFSDVFVFPSLTDTFGIVLLEALASGTPVAAYPVTGPKDAVGESGVAILNNDLGLAAKQALLISRDKCREFALTHTWQESAEQFIFNVKKAQNIT